MPRGRRAACRRRSGRSEKSRKHTHTLDTLAFFVPRRRLLELCCPGPPGQDVAQEPSPARSWLVFCQREVWVRLLDVTRPRPLHLGVKSGRPACYLPTCSSDARAPAHAIRLCPACSGSSGPPAVARVASGSRGGMWWSVYRSLLGGHLLRTLNNLEDNC